MLPPVPPPPDLFLFFPGMNPFGIAAVILGMNLKLEHKGTVERGTNKSSNDSNDTKQWKGCRVAQPKQTLHWPPPQAPTLIRRFLPRCCRHFLHSGSRQGPMLKTVDCQEEGLRSLTSAARKPLINKADTLWACSTKLKQKRTNLSVQLTQLDHSAPGPRRDLFSQKYHIIVS